MISFVRGRVAKIGPGFAVIDVNGFGMHVHTTLNAVKRLEVGHDAQLDTAMVVKEDSQALYGFADDTQREIFELLITVSGIGPRIALAILNTHSVSDIRIAAAREDDKVFSEVSGIGPKMAKKIILELSGKLAAADNNSDSCGNLSGVSSWESIVQEALVGLGWSDKESRRSVIAFKSQEPELAKTGDSTTILRNILRLIGTQKVQVSGKD